MFSNNCSSTSGLVVHMNRKKKRLKVVENGIISFSCLHRCTLWNKWEPRKKERAIDRM